MLAEPLLLLHTPTHAAAHNTTQHAGCCGQQPTLAYTQCHVRQENYANLVTALPPQNSLAAAHVEVACTAFAVILMTTRKSTASSICEPCAAAKKSTSSTNDHSNAAKRKEGEGILQQSAPKKRKGETRKRLNLGQKREILQLLDQKVSRVKVARRFNCGVSCLCT